jgi:hypothetical protein
MKMDFRLRGNDKMGKTATSAIAAVKMKNEANPTPLVELRRTSFTRTEFCVMRIA